MSEPDSPSLAASSSAAANLGPWQVEELLNSMVADRQLAASVFTNTLTNEQLAMEGAGGAAYDSAPLTPTQREPAAEAEQQQQWQQPQGASDVAAAAIAEVLAPTAPAIDQEAAAAATSAAANQAPASQDPVEAGGDEPQLSF